MKLPLIAQTPITVQQKVYTSYNSEKREIFKFGLAVYLPFAANMRKTRCFLLLCRLFWHEQNSPDEKIFNKSKKFAITS